MSKTYSGEYLEGLKDGRIAFKDAKAEGAARVEAVGQAELRFCDSVSRCMGSGLPESADYIKGLRDFWTHQLALTT